MKHIWKEVIEVMNMAISIETSHGHLGRLRVCDEIFQLIFTTATNMKSTAESNRNPSTGGNRFFAFDFDRRSH